MRQAVKKVCGAIKRVNNPTTCWIVAFNLGTLFAHKPVGRTGIKQIFFDCRFGLLVSTRHKVTRAFGRHLKIFNFCKVLKQCAASLAGHLHHHIEICTASHLDLRNFMIKRGV